MQDGGKRQQPSHTAPGAEGSPGTSQTKPLSTGRAERGQVGRSERQHPGRGRGEAPWVLEKSQLCVKAQVTPKGALGGGKGVFCFQAKTQQLTI